MRAGFAEVYGTIDLFTILTKGDGLNRFVNEFARFHDIRFFDRPFPTILQIVGNHGGNFTHLQGDGRHLGEVLLFGNILYRIYNIKNNS